MDDGLNYSLEARMRVALSASAAQTSTDAASLVPTHGEYGCPRGELVEVAAQVVDTATRSLTFAIVCERQRGTDWERIAEILGEDTAAVRERFEAPVTLLQRGLVEAWLDPARAADLPEGADDPGGTAARLDAWLTGTAAHDDTFSHHPDSEVRAHPVTAGLAIMSLAEHGELVDSAATLIADQDQSRRTNLHRRKIALLEWLLAEELSHPRGSGRSDEKTLRTLLEAARRDLAGLTC